VRIVFVSLLIVIADQASKIAVKGIDLPALGVKVRGLIYGTSIPVLGDFLRLTYIENPGMAFGIDLGGKLLFSLFSVAASAGILYYLYRARDEPLPFRLSLAMILGRYVPAVAVLAMAGSLAEKKYVPPSLGTLPTDKAPFAVWLTLIILIVGALTFFPALAMGPIAEHLMMTM